jgi:hypothetical protein
MTLRITNLISEIRDFETTITVKSTVAAAFKDDDDA